MRGKALEVLAIVADDELRSALKAALDDHFGQPVRIERLERRVSQYCSSYLIEELDVTLEDRGTLALIFKDLSKVALLAGVDKIKPEFIYNPVREIETYQRLLMPYRLGTATYYGASVEPERGRYWLFLERVPPSLLWQMGDFSRWEDTASWLAGMHSRVACEVENSVADHSRHFIVYDREFYRRWIDRASVFIRVGDRSAQRKAVKAIRWISERYDDVVEHLLALSRTVIHGEFQASNVMVDETPGHLRICPVDWEMTAIAPGLVDLAALTGGNWTPEQRRKMALAYWNGVPMRDRQQTDEMDFLRSLEFCRLHLAVQWLGWAPGWEPPPEHAQDWLADALSSAHTLNL